MEGSTTAGVAGMVAGDERGGQLFGRGRGSRYGAFERGVFGTEQTSASRRIERWRGLGQKRPETTVASGGADAGFRASVDQALGGMGRRVRVGLL